MVNGTADFETEMILNAYLFKKNIRVYYLNSQTDKIYLTDMLLAYDSSNEHNIVKIFLRSQNSQKLTLDVLCNTFEYEILYKKAYPLTNIWQTQIPTQDKQSTNSKHKRGYSMGSGV